ncbi:MAG: response regulator transcription factor [Spongiibacteraceae bacterium]|jgi:DNA-binding NarL/FixJ family response regulator|nr:response regulator transcription factor [Spongiibacteraceae bacterium]
MSNGKRIMLVDDHPMVRQGLAHLLQDAGFTIAGEADGKNEALERIRAGVADLVILDLELDGSSGLALLPILRGHNLRVMVFTMHDDPVTVRQTMAAGADGFVTKRETAQSLLVGIAAVLRGETYLSPRAASALQAAAPEADLTGQQLRVFLLMGHGLGNDEIARQMGISVRTLESYCVRIIDKLGLSGVRELRQKAVNDAVRQGGGH